MPRESPRAIDDEIEAVAGYVSADRRSLFSYLPGMFFALYLFALPVYSLLRAFEATHTLQLMTFVIPVLLAAVSTAHLIGSRGRIAGALMASTALVIAFAAEAFGSSTGLLFGSYSYTATLGPKLVGLVPWLIPVAWLGMLCLARGTVDFLFGFPARPASLRARAARIGLAALALTAWDLSLDPRMVADGHWVWIGGGAYFGIPLSNFVGWWITGAAVYAVWDWLDGRFKPITFAAPTSILDSRLVPVWGYVAVWLGESMANIVFWSGPVIGAIVFVAMGAFGAPALAKLIRQTGVVPRLQQLWA